MGHIDLLESGRLIATRFIPFLFALCFHEFAHAWMARLKGDRTAEMMGRLTLNPMAHADPIGTFFLPLAAIIFQAPFYFGWARPVPVNGRNLKNYRADMFWVALAGPLSNLLLALIAAFLLVIDIKINGPILRPRASFEIIRSFMGCNLILAFFNLIPLHPLDGGKVLARFLPARANHFLESNEHASSILLAILIFSGGLDFLAVPIMFFGDYFLGIASWIIR